MEYGYLLYAVSCFRVHWETVHGDDAFQLSIFRT